MEQRISLVTLGVSDLARARQFYEQLGWRGQQAEETVFFQAGGLALVLWSRASLAADSGLDDRGTDGFGGVTLAHNVRGGYAGCFTDPDGHVWEIAHNPGFTLGPDGALILPGFG